MISLASYPQVHTYYTAIVLTHLVTHVCHNMGICYVFLCIKMYKSIIETLSLFSPLCEYNIMKLLLDKFYLQNNNILLKLRNVLKFQFSEEETTKKTRTGKTFLDELNLQEHGRPVYLYILGKFCSKN